MKIKTEPKTNRIIITYSFIERVKLLFFGRSVLYWAGQDDPNNPLQSQDNVVNLKVRETITQLEETITFKIFNG
jgi:hypothetical protein